jgi:hypothetical protein
MRYTEKLETLAFAIECVTACHTSTPVPDRVGHHFDVKCCTCKHGCAVRNLQDEMKTTQCAIDSVAKRGPKGGRS